MKLSDFNYSLDTTLIAQKPAEWRDHSRLLVVDTGRAEIAHRHFFNIVNFFQAGDVLVLNDSKVLAARLLGRKESGERVEVFLLQQKNSRTWECLVKGKNTAGAKIIFDKKLTGIITKEKDGFGVTFNIAGKKLSAIIAAIGLTPLPPYIKKVPTASDRMRYQTVYAANKKLGSVAAPTAGLHFTKVILKKLARKGVHLEYVTLHVGLGTFLPVKVTDITKHTMHAERVEVSAQTLRAIARAKRDGRRVIACGTTSVRVLESIVAGHLTSNSVKKISGEVNIFIYPGFKFQIVDALITNFHLPKSTLLMLVAAFLEHKGYSHGAREIKRLYAVAQREKYHFFSYGDAMLIISPPAPLLSKERGGE